MDPAARHEKEADESEALATSALVLLNEYSQGKCL